MTFMMIIKIISHYWPLVPMLRTGNLMTRGGSVSNHLQWSGYNQYKQNTASLLQSIIMAACAAIVVTL